MIRSALAGAAIAEPGYLDLSNNPANGFPAVIPYYSTNCKSSERTDSGAARYRATPIAAHATNKLVDLLQRATSY